MVDYSNADAIAAIFRDEAAPLFAANFHADTYQVVDVLEVSDGYGGHTEQEVAIESGRCELQTFSPNWGGVMVRSGVVMTEARYVIEILPPTVISSSHVVYVNGRRFEVQNVVRDGNAGMFTYAALDEKGPRT